MSAYHQDRSDCTLPPPPDDHDLIAALDDQIDTEVWAHLQICPFCAARANDIAAFQRILQQQLYRMFCPSSENLLAFQQRMINPERYITIANHIQDCPDCTRELRMLEQAATNSGLFPNPGLFPTQRIALKLEHYGLFPFTTRIPSKQTYRSLSDHYVYRADRIRLTLSVERAFERPHRSIITGRLLLSTSGGNHHGRTASLLSGEQILSSSLIDKLGYFTIEDVPPGNVTLSLRLQHCEVVVDPLNV